MDRLPISTPLIFFLLGYVKNLVYQVKKNDVQQQTKDRVRYTMAT